MKSFLLEKQGIDLRLTRPRTIYQWNYTDISACVVCLFLCLCLCEHAMEPKVCLSDSFSIFKQGLLLSLKVTDWLYWLASQLLGPSCFHPTHIVIFDGIIKEIYKDILRVSIKALDNRGKERGEVEGDRREAEQTSDTTVPISTLTACPSDLTSFHLITYQGYSHNDKCLRQNLQYVDLEKVKFQLNTCLACTRS